MIYQSILDKFIDLLSGTFVMLLEILPWAGLLCILFALLMFKERKLTTSVLFFSIGLGIFLIIFYFKDTDNFFVGSFSH